MTAEERRKKRVRARATLLFVAYLAGFACGAACERMSTNAAEEMQQPPICNCAAHEEAAAAADIIAAAEEATITSETFTYLGEYKTTAYCACAECCGIYADGFTATGAKAVEGITIAVDPDVIPYGTAVLIDGNRYIAQDCGGAIKGNHIDIYFDDHNDALAYGVQMHEVYVKKEI